LRGIVPAVIDAQHDPGIATAQARTAAAATAARFASSAPLERVAPLRLASGCRLLIGVASWTDASMTAPGVFYPAGARSAESRLRYYAGRFPLVEVDSTYYALPARRTAELWVRRTPAGFVFNVKAHALMTGQPSEVDRLPAELREALDLPPQVLDAVWSTFLDAVSPLREHGRLGSILLQYPRWIGPSRASAARIAAAAERLKGWPAAVELRNRAWFDERTRTRTLQFLRERALSHVVVDAPPGFDSSVPAVPAVTNPALSVIRFHGRNVDTWEAKVSHVRERFRYLYDERQLAEWLPVVTAVGEQAQEVHIVFNNCYGNYGTTNALEIASLLVRSGAAH
jgi:uncharacterized protein YecE (DUF72 family)